MSYATQLESVQTTIAKIELTGQAYSIGGRSLSRADLEVLYTREKYLIKKVSRETSGGIRIRGVTPV